MVGEALDLFGETIAIEPLDGVHDPGMQGAQDLLGQVRGSVASRRRESCHARLAVPLYMDERLATLPTNFASSRLGSPHAAQAASRRIPHSSQNTAPTGVSCWH